LYSFDEQLRAVASLTALTTLDISYWYCRKVTVEAVRELATR
jgi:hypothetical protein